MSEEPNPITVRLQDDLLAALDEECDAVDLSRSEYIRSILRDREVAEQIATSEIKSRQLQKLKEILLDRVDELESTLTAGGITTIPETYDDGEIADKMAQHGLDIANLDQAYLVGFHSVLDCIEALPEKSLQIQAIELAATILQLLQSTESIYYQQTIMQLIEDEIVTGDPNYTFSLTVWPWLKELWLTGTVTITPHNGDLKIA
jgi:hypothetical protein